jgi:hypothetical protein
MCLLELVVKSRRKGVWCREYTQLNTYEFNKYGNEPSLCTVARHELDHHSTENESGFIMLELLISYTSYRLDKTNIVATDPIKTPCYA